MAYATGSATTANLLLAELATFSGGQGWTIDKNATGLLFLSKGICFVQMQTNTYNYNDFATGVPVSTPDTRLEMSLGTGVTVALNTFFGHPGSLSTTSTDVDRCSVNNLQGPFSEYHFYAGTAPDYILVAVKTGADTWRHFGFGLLEQGDLTHSGVAWLTGHMGFFYRSQLAVNSGLKYNSISEANFPYCKNVLGAEAYSCADSQHYAPNALPVSAGWDAMRADGEMFVIYGRTDPTIVTNGYPAVAPGNFGRLLNPIYRATPSQWGGNTMLFPIPVMLANASQLKTCYVGNRPGVRLINMEGLQNGQDLLFGSETWQVFSIGRLTGWGSQAQLGLQYATGLIGVAYRKVI